MSAAEDKSWEYTLGRIDERTQQIERELSEVKADVRQQVGTLQTRINDVENNMLTRINDVENNMLTRINNVESKMLTKGTFFAVLAVVTALLATLITMD